MAGSIGWLLLAYRLPREPSTPRIAVWRKLGRLGVLKIGDGLVGLPAEARSQEQLEWIADEIVEAGGEATLWRSTLTSARAERALVERMTGAIAAEYRRVIAEAEEAGAGGRPARRPVVARLRRKLRAISQRDYFAPPEREEARRAVESLAGESLAVESRRAGDRALSGQARP
jgi:ChrB-like protein